MNDLNMKFNVVLHKAGYAADALAALAWSCVPGCVAVTREKAPLVSNSSQWLIEQSKRVELAATIHATGALIPIRLEAFGIFVVPGAWVTLALGQHLLSIGNNLIYAPNPDFPSRTRFNRLIIGTPRLKNLRMPVLDIQAQAGFGEILSKTVETLPLAVLVTDPEKLSLSATEQILHLIKQNQRPDYEI
jgi:hypothetical protein